MFKMLYFFINIFQKFDTIQKKKQTNDIEILYILGPHNQNAKRFLKLECKTDIFGFQNQKKANKKNILLFFGLIARIIFYCFLQTCRTKTTIFLTN